MFYFSKSKYRSFCGCPKKVWLEKYKPDTVVYNDFALSLMKTGNEVGDLAMGYFGDFVEVTAFDGEKLDLPKMIERTKEELAKNTPVICEASFSMDGLYCAVDILKQENGGYAIYEVKSSTGNKNPRHIDDVAYQKYVLEHCGINVTGTYLMYINNRYVFDGTLNLQKLFVTEDISDLVDKKLPDVESDLAAAKQLLSNGNEPDIDIGINCTKPDDCECWYYCSRHLPKPNVFDIYRLSAKTKSQLYAQGLVDYASLEGNSLIKGALQKRQIDFGLHDRGVYVDKKAITKFLATLSFPLYFLDFETFMPVIPKYVGTKPYAQIPFQYSLHYVESEDGEIKHKEFLAQAGSNPLRPIAESLCRDIPADACVAVFNKSMECGRLQDLAKFFPDLSDHLLAINTNIVDFWVPFRSGWYYNKEMGGSFSIKSVLPALFPNDPNLDYHNLEGIHHGGEAMEAFPAMENMSPEELAETRKNLLKYCELDTYALVKIWQKFKEATQ